METGYRKISDPLRRFFEKADFGPLLVTDPSSLKKKIYPECTSILFYRRNILLKLLRLYVIHSQKSKEPWLQWDPILGQLFSANIFPLRIERFIIQNTESVNDNLIQAGQKFDNMDELLIQKTFDHWTYQLSC